VFCAAVAHQSDPSVGMADVAKWGKYGKAAEAPTSELADLANWKHIRWGVFDFFSILHFNPYFLYLYCSSQSQCMGWRHWFSWECSGWLWGTQYGGNGKLRSGEQGSSVRRRREVNGAGLASCMVPWVRRCFLGIYRGGHVLVFTVLE